MLIKLLLNNSVKGFYIQILKHPRDLRHRVIGGALLPSGPEALPPTTLAQGWGNEIIS